VGGSRVGDTCHHQQGPNAGGGNLDEYQSAVTEVR
jgi:hypothetical protein